MTYLIVVIVAVLLFMGFLMLTAYETRRGSRLFAGARYRLDTKVSKMFFVFEHVDWGAFSAHLTRTTATTLAHDIAHGTLVAVRAVERFLTRAVRSLRTQRDTAATLSAPTSPAVVIETIEVKPEPAPTEVTPEDPVSGVVVEVAVAKETQKESRKPRVVRGIRGAQMVTNSTPHPAPALPNEPAPARKPMIRAPRRMDIPRRTKSKDHGTVHESGNEPETNTPV